MQIELRIGDADVEQVARVLACALAEELRLVLPQEQRRSESSLLTVAEAAEALRVNRTTVYELVRRGELSATKVASRTRIRRSDLDRYLG